MNLELLFFVAVLFGIGILVLSLWFSTKEQEHVREIIETLACCALGVFFLNFAVVFLLSVSSTLSALIPRNIVMYVVLTHIILFSFFLSTAVSLHFLLVKSDEPSS